MKARGLLAVLVALATTTSGCLGLFGGDEDVDQQDAGPDARIPDNVIDLVENRFRNFTFPAQSALPAKVVWYNDTVGPEANTAVENTRDDGGTDINGVIKAMDISPHIPVGQPVEIAIRLFWDASEGNSADLDLYVDVPGTSTESSRSQDDLNFNVPSESTTVNTVGVAGHTPLIGVQASNGRITSGLDFHVEMRFTYAKDVLTPHHAYAFQVPGDASALILESVKAAGDEHVRSRFVILDNDDQLVTYMSYDDLSIPTESVFIPITRGGEYVFYAYDMRGGFLALKADVPLNETAARVLPLAEERVEEVSGPAPGTVARNWLAPAQSAPTPQAGGTTVDLNFPDFPLRVTGFVDASSSGGLTGSAQVTVESSQGVVHQYTRIGRLDGDAGTVGFTDDEGQNDVFNPQNMTTGAYTITITQNGNGIIGYTILNYVR